MNMRRLLLPLLILPVAVFADGGGLPNQPYIYVEGKAEIQKPADIITLRFELVARNADQVKANQTLQANASKLLALFSARKIADSDMIADDLTSEPEYENGNQYSEKRGKFIGYVVKRSFSIKIRDIKIFPKLADEIIAVAGVEFGGIDSSLANEKELTDELWDKAVANARQRAEKTLQSTGMKIDSIFAISPVGFLAIQSQIFGEEGVPYAARASIPTAEEVGPPQYRIAPVTISQKIHVIYLISPAK